MSCAKFFPHYPKSSRNVGKACIRGMRVTVSMILGHLTSGRTAQNIADYPYLEEEDITIMGN